MLIGKERPAQAGVQAEVTLFGLVPAEVDCVNMLESLCRRDRPAQLLCVLLRSVKPNFLASSPTRTALPEAAAQAIASLQHLLDIGVSPSEDHHERPLSK